MLVDLLLTRISYPLHWIDQVYGVELSYYTWMDQIYSKELSYYYLDGSG